MKRNIVWTMLLVALLVLSLAAVAKDKDGFKCSLEEIAGTWGYTETGMIVITDPSQGGTILTLAPYASVGKYTIDRDGNLSGARTASQAGKIIRATIEGTATVNPDCTGKITLNFPGNPPAEKFIVYVNNGREARMIITTAPYPSVLVTEAKKLFPDSDNDHDGPYRH